MPKKLKQSFHPPPKKSGPSFPRRTLPSSVHQRDWRRRERRGEARTWVTYRGATIDYLVATRWLTADRCDDKAAIGEAIGRLVEDFVRAGLKDL